MDTVADTVADTDTDTDTDADADADTDADSDTDVVVLAPPARTGCGCAEAPRGPGFAIFGRR